MSDRTFKHCVVVDDKTEACSGPEAVHGTIMTGVHGMGRIGEKDHAGSVMIEVICHVVMKTEMLTAGTIDESTARELAEEFVDRSAIVIREVAEDLSTLMSGKASN